MFTGLISRANVRVQLKKPVSSDANVIIDRENCRVEKDGSVAEACFPHSIPRPPLQLRRMSPSIWHMCR